MLHPPGRSKPPGEAARVEVGAVEPGDRLGDARCVLGHLAELVAGDAEIAEHLVGEDLGQPRHAARLRVRRQ